MGLRGRNIVVLVGGGIAAFKAVELVRECARRGAAVKVAMTPSATRFVGPVTFTGLTGEPPVVDLWDPSFAGEVHVALSEWADAIAVAPATANLMARAAHGMADDAVLATLRCAAGPVLYAPAMHTRMWRSAPTQRAVQQLVEDGARLVGPVEGALANGEQGEGRMAEPDAIADALERLLEAGQDLAGRHVVVSAGPTVEDLDPVRYLSNRSTGRMGFAVAAAAAARGASCTLVAGPVHLPNPPGVQRIDVRSALDMQAAVQRHAKDADAVVMTAAVADYRPAKLHAQKRKKSDAALTLELVPNPDILADLGRARQGGRPILVGFALETQNVVEYAKRKLRAKGVDLIVANRAADGFAGDTNVATFVSPEAAQPQGKLPKSELAHRIWDWVAARLAGREVETS